MLQGWTRRLGAYLVLSAAVVAACSKDGSDIITPGPTPTITVAVVPGALDLNQGATAPATVTVTRGGGFDGAVTIAVEGLPGGVTASNITIAAGSNAGTLNFAATSAAPAVTSTVTIRGTGTGVQPATASLALTVKPVVVETPAIGMTLSNNALSLQQGANGAVTVNLTRSGGFSGAINLTATGLPAGVTASFNPASATTNSSTLTLTAAPGANVGPATVTVRGNGTGVTEKTATLNLTVTAAPVVPGGNVTFAFCGATGIPLWVAAQDGSGAWTRVTSATSSYNFQITSRGGIAYVVPAAGGGFDLQVMFGTSAELIAQGPAMCGANTGAGVTVNGAVAGAAPTDLVLLGMQRAIGTTAASNTTYSIPGVPAGSFDLIAGKTALTIGGPGGVTFTPNKFFIRRNASSAAAGTLDFAGADAFDPVQRTVTLNNLQGQMAMGIMLYTTSTSRSSLYIEATPAAGATRPYFGVPAARQQPTDFHVLNMIAMETLESTTTRQAGIAFNAATDKAVTFGPFMATTTVTSLGSGRVRTVFNIQSEYNRLFNADFQHQGATPRRTSIQMTGGYNGAGPTATLELPDFTAVAGFDPLWTLRSGVAVTVNSIATGWTGAGGVSEQPFTEGTTYVAASRRSSITL